MNRSNRAILVITMVAVVSVAVPAGAGSAPVVNGWIALDSDRTGNDEIFVIRPDGTNPTNLTNNPATDGTPAWSPDGTRVAFWTNRDANGEIYVMNADGSGQARLTNAAGSDQWPAWSPDGSKIAFRSTRDANSEIYVMNADGSGQVNLTNDSASDDNPTWSPDGTKIAFTSNRDDPSSDIFVMNASDGSNPTNITNDAEFQKDPAWSPDGTRIAFIGQIGGDNDVLVMGADGSNPTPLTVNDDAEYDPAWGPDGTRIAFERDVAGSDLEIWAMNADGSGQVNLTNNPESDSEPAWQPVPVPPLDVAKDRVKEGKKTKVFVELSTPAVGTIPLTFKAVRGTAKRNKDFKPSTGTIVFAAGESYKVVRVKTREDAREERKERFFLRVTVAGVTAQGPIIILDDD